MNRLKNLYWIALIVFLVNLAVRLVYADANTLHGDEPFTVYFSQWPIADINKILSSGNNPPTFEVLLHGWMNLAESSILWLRLLPCLFISFAGVGVALIAHRMGGVRMVIASSILFLMTNFLMEYAHNVRVYAMLICFSCWSVRSFLVLSDRPNFTNSIVWTLTTLLVIYGHYFGILIVICQWLAIVTTCNLDKKFIKKFAILNSLVMLLSTPLILVMLKRYFATMGENTFEARQVNLKSLYDISLFALNKNEYLLLLLVFIFLFGLFFFIKSKFPYGIQSWILTLATLISTMPIVGYIFWTNEKHFLLTLLNMPIWTIFSVAFITSLLVYILKQNHVSFEIRLIILWFIAPILILWICSFRMNVLLDRYLVHVLTAMTLLIPAVIFSLPKRLSWLAIVATLVFYISSFNLNPRRNFDNGYAEAKLKSIMSKGTVVILSPGYEDFRFLYEYDKNIFFDALNHRADTSGKRIIDEMNSTVYKEGMRRALRRDNIFVINKIDMLDFSLDTVNDIIHYDHNTALCYPDNDIKGTLEAEFGVAKKEEISPDGIRLYTYSRQ